MTESTVPAHRFFLEGQGWKTGTEVDLVPLYHQLVRVLRVQAGTQILLLDGQGGAFVTEIRQIERRTLVGRVVNALPAPPEPEVRLTLYQCVLKGDKLEWIWQKGTELGVTRFVPVISRRTLVQSGGALRGRAGRWQKIVREAAEQCYRGVAPEVAPPMAFDVAIAQAQGVRLMPWEGAAGRPGLMSALSEPLAGEVNLMIGPEGGFEDEEAAAAEAAGWQIVTLGRRTLRAETAAIAAAALTMAAAGEVGVAYAPPAPAEAVEPAEVQSEAPAAKQSEEPAPKPGKEPPQAPVVEAAPNQGKAPAA